MGVAYTWILPPLKHSMNGTHLKTLANGQLPLPLKMINILWQRDRPANI